MWVAVVVKGVMWGYMQEKLSDCHFDEGGLVLDINVPQFV
jgi:hypothetical protein